MSSKNNFTSLKEVYEKIMGAKRKPPSISYKGEVFYNYNKGKLYMKVYPMVERGFSKDAIRSLDFHDKGVVVHRLEKEVVEWYSPEDITSPEHIALVIKIIIERVYLQSFIAKTSRSPYLWLDFFQRAVFREALKNKVKDAVELWNYILTLKGMGEDYDKFIEMIENE